MANVIDYDNNLRVNVRNQSGPKRTIVNVDEQSTGTLLTLSCGHVGDFNQIFHYDLGSEISCYSCRFSPDNVISSESL